MYEALRKLIFGLDEFEKVKIEDRYKQIDVILDSLQLEKIEDFEILEQCLYKIKEQLRIRSSNLNKTISDSSNSLKKSDVLRIIEKLEKIKYDFLGNAFERVKVEKPKIEGKEKEVKDEEPVKEEIQVEGPKPEEKVSESQQTPETNIAPIPKQKEEEDSLDSLLGNMNETKDEEKKQESVKEEVKEEIKVEEPKPEEKVSNPIGGVKYEVYRDDNVVAYFEEDTIARGELIIKPFSDKKLNELNESEISYMSIFSKVFASILFELIGAHGTNIFWNYKENSLHIVPRYENDKVDFKMKSEKATEDFLEQIKQRLLNDMGKKAEINEEKVSEQHPKPEVEKVEGEPVPIQNTPVKKPKPELREDSKERGDFLMKKLKRMP